MAFLSCPPFAGLLRPSDQIIAILASRFVVTPLIAVGLLAMGSKMDLIPSDKIIWFVLLMEA